MAFTLLQTTCLGGIWQMAIDAALLELGQPVLRFYSWSRPTLSLGFHQRPAASSWLDWQARNQGELVRRPTGGGAVLHGGDLCYALVWPEPGCSRLQAYERICAWLQDAFAALGQPLLFGGDPCTVGHDCFARSTPADLVDGRGCKRIGSAQRWLRGCLLQHGSIQLNPDVDHWQVLFGTQPPAVESLNLDADTLAGHLRHSASSWLGLSATAHPLPAGLLSLAGERLERHRISG
jgi:lipoate-protein ligase A